MQTPITQTQGAPFARETSAQKNKSQEDLDLE